MPESAIVPRTGFLRWDRLHPLLQQRLGEDATRPEMADHLGIGYITFWRLTNGTGKRYPASEQVVNAILTAFPDQTFGDLFDTEGLPARRPRRTAKTDPTGPERLYTVLEVADVWSCSKTDVYKLIRQGKLPTVNLGVGKPKVRISETAMAAYVASENKGRTRAA